MLSTTSEDGQLAVWDLALERDPEEEAALAASMNAASPNDLPPQLLFVHIGQVPRTLTHQPLFTSLSGCYLSCLCSFSSCIRDRCQKLPTRLCCTSVSPVQLLVPKPGCFCNVYLG
jgi:hypothetical protein